MNSNRGRAKIKHTNFSRRIFPRYREVPISISENPIFRFSGIYMGGCQIAPLRLSEEMGASARRSHFCAGAPRAGAPRSGAPCPGPAFASSGSLQSLPRALRHCKRSCVQARPLRLMSQIGPGQNWLARFYVSFCRKGCTNKNGSSTLSGAQVA